MKTIKIIVSLLIIFNLISIKEAPGQEPASGSVTNRLTSGNVGIGTTNPVEKLHLEGGNFLMRSVNPFIFMDNSNGAGTVGLAFQYEQQWKGWIYYNEAFDHLLINAEAGAGYRPDLVIKSNGYLGIGTNNPQYKLQVEGDLYVHDYYPFLFLDNTDETGNAGIQFKTNGAIKGHLYYDDYYDHLTINTDAGGYRPDFILKPNGMLGIGTFNPTAKLHVVGELPGNTAIFGTHIAPWSAGTNLSVGNTGEDAAIYVGQGSGYTGYLWWDYNSYAPGASFRIGTFSGSNPLYLQPNGGGVKVGNSEAPPYSAFEVYLNTYHYAMLGYSSAQSNYFYHSEASSDGDGQSCIFGYRTHTDQNDGMGYGRYTSNSSIMGYNYWGDNYSFGTTGFNDNDLYRCGGVLGAQTGGSYWGSLGYEDSGGNYFGGYFNSSGGGGGKMRESECQGIGIGSWGNLLGANIHGKIYGVYSEGGHFALFTNGIVYKNDLDVHLQKDKQGGNTILYTSVSTGATVQTCGTAMLSGGRAGISFDPAFISAVSPDEPVVVTVTPVGNSNGVYLSSVSREGFTIAENNEGRSNIMVNYIAVGKRAGFENPELSAEVIDPGFVDKMNKGLHDDGDLETNGQGLYYENGQLIVGIPPSTLPDLKKPEETRLIPLPVSSTEQSTAGYNKMKKEE